MKMPKNQLFALDIGTRSVIGLLLRPEGNKYEIVDYEFREHAERAMLDGQIHDIDKVAEVVKQVAGSLQERNGDISQAAIAAAGRSLVTERATAEIDIDLTAEIDKEVTDRLQMLAVQSAQAKVDAARQRFMEARKAREGEGEGPDSDGSDMGADGSAKAKADEPIDGEGRAVKRALSTDDYYTVGHSVIEYRLDDSLILNPHGHRGSKLAIDIIATFLPHIVVDSLYSVINRAGLEVLNLTLEPIAAMNVAIPKNLRLLNLALVDIGAGTSDIAISRDGTIHSYGMVAMAGDSMTEVISSEHLLDFNSAEKVKIASGTQDKIEYTDVLGFKHNVDSSEVLGKVEGKIEELTQKIADSIVELNGKAPSAVFCIGGGSQLKGVKEKLREKLGLPEDRVAVKSLEQLDMVSSQMMLPDGPEFITPIGIGITAVEERDHDFLQVNVGSKAIRIFNTKNVKLSDALLLAGFNARSLLSERGPSIFVTVDGKKEEIRGEFGEPASIFVNGKPSSLDAAINHQDQIVVVPAKPGTERLIKLSELMGERRHAFIGGSKINFVDYVAVGGMNRTGDYVLKDGDDIATKGAKTISEFMKRAEIDEHDYVLVLDGVPQKPEAGVIANAKYEMVSRDRVGMAEFDGESGADVGGSTADGSGTGGSDADGVGVSGSDASGSDIDGSGEGGSQEMGEGSEVTASAGSLKAKGGKEKVYVYGDEKKIEEEERRANPKVPAKMMTITVNGDSYKVKEGTRFVDLFDIIGFDTDAFSTSNYDGTRKFEMLKNGRKALVMDTLKAGDEVIIRWKESEEK